MTETEQQTKSIKPSYDARKPYSELLIDLIEKIISAAHGSDAFQWELFLKQYYSLTQKFIGRSDKEKVLEIFSELNNIKNPIRSNRIYRIQGDNTKLFNKLGPIKLMELQVAMFSATSHLLIPSQESDDDLDFDEAGVIGNG